MKYCPHTGKEPSPKGLGFCARNETIGTVAQGRDNNMWIVVSDKNSRGYWRRIPTIRSPKKITRMRLPKKVTKKVTKKVCPKGKKINPKTGRCKKL